MSKFFSRRPKRRAQGGIPSAGYLLEWAVLLAVLFIIAHVAGLRQFTSILNGTNGSTTLDWQTAAFFGVVYIFVYLGFVIAVPVLILAAGILKIWQRALPTKGVLDGSRSNTQTH